MNSLDPAVDLDEVKTILVENQGVWEAHTKRRGGVVRVVRLEGFEPPKKPVSGWPFEDVEKPEAASEAVLADARQYVLSESLAILDVLAQLSKDDSPAAKLVRLRLGPFAAKASSVLFLPLAKKGQPPFGYCIDEKGRYAERPNEQEVLSMARVLRQQGKTWVEIADVAKQKSLFSRSGAPHHPALLRQKVENYKPILPLDEGLEQVKRKSRAKNK